MQNSLKRFITDSGWAFASVAIAAFVQFILRVFLARYYGSGDLGLYTLAFTIYSLGLIFSGLGIGAGLLKYIAEISGSTHRTNILVTSGITTSFFSGCIMGLILYIVSPYISNYFFKMPELTILFRIVSFSFPFIAIEKATLGFLNGLRRMRLFAFINIFQNILVIILTLTFALTGYDIKYIIIGLVLPTALTSILSLFFIRESLFRPNVVECSASIKMLLIFGFYVVLANGMGVIQTYVDSTMLGFFMTDKDVGIYSVARTLLLILLLPPQAIQSITTPMIASYWGKRETINIEYLINKCMKYAASYALIIAFTVGFISNDLIKLFFGGDFISAAFPFQILLAGAVLVTIQSSIGGALSSTAYVKKIFMITGAAVILNLALNILLIPRFGIIGSAVASSSSMAIGALIQLYFIHRLIKIKIDWLWFIKLTSFTVILAGGTYLLGEVTNLYFSTALAIIILTIVIGKYFLSQEDQRQIKIFIHRQIYRLIRVSAHN